MSEIFVDTRRPTNGTGSKLNPLNTAMGLVPQLGDTVSFASGSVIPLASVANLINVAITLGLYGDGDRPRFIGYSERPGSNFTAEPNGTYSLALGSNIGGNVREDGWAMRFRAWSTSTVEGVTTTAADLLQPGQFTFDYTPGAYKLYVRPRSGPATGHTYWVSDTLYGLRSVQNLPFLNIRDVEIDTVSAHAISLMNCRNVKIHNVVTRMAGGAWSSGGAFHFGNGIELGPGCVGAEVDSCQLYSTFDSPATSQTFGAAGAFLSNHHWWDILCDEFGLCAFEVATTTAFTRISDIWAERFTVSRGGVDCWAGNRGGVVVSNYAHAAGAIVNNVHFRDFAAENVQRLWTAGGTSGVCSAQDIVGTNVLDYVASSNKVVNYGTGQRDFWCNVRDDKGRRPSNDPAINGSANGKFLEARAGISWATALVM